MRLIELINISSLAGLYDLGWDRVGPQGAVGLLFNYHSLT